jgi:hypothetical protein
VFLKLNTTTKTTGSSPKAIETILRNFEDNLIDEDACISMLGCLGKVLQIMAMRIRFIEG